MCCFFTTLWLTANYVMHCKFLEHGLALSYDHVVKPCCEWDYNQDWAQRHKIDIVDLGTWHQHPDIVDARNKLANDIWPSSCVRCERQEQQGRGDSVRLNGSQSYANYFQDDITLEIRPGNVCNFACQTCWPEASSRVTQFQSQAGMIAVESVDSTSMTNFDFLLPVANRVKNVVLLGGEPFYDKNCLKFLDWATQHLTANIILFTNGSHVNWDWVDQFPGKITMVFSIDAIGKPAEYIRFGTEWSTVYANLQRAQSHPKLELRVNITTSIYNYWYLDQVIYMLMANWPSVVSFGHPRELHLLESAVPPQHRPQLINRLQDAINKIKLSKIEYGQRYNARNVIQSILNNLQQLEWDPVEFKKFKDYVGAMDRVKRIDIADYCPELADILKE